jgi:predicted RNA-binding protein with PIN domain
MRWIIDGMNVIGCRPDGWWHDRACAITSLVHQLERWAASEGQQVTVVFERPPLPPIISAGITVASAPKPAANSADDEIVRLVSADVALDNIRVVTSDRALSARVRQLGASVSSAERFRDLIDPAR